MRQDSGLSQAAFAERYAIAPATLRDWEEARVAPPLYAVAFLRLAAHHPQAREEIEALRGSAA